MAHQSSEQWRTRKVTVHHKSYRTQALVWVPVRYWIVWRNRKAAQLIVPPGIQLHDTALTDDGG